MNGHYEYLTEMNGDFEYVEPEDEYLPSVTSFFNSEDSPDLEIISKLLIESL